MQLVLCIPIRILRLLPCCNLLNVRRDGVDGWALALTEWALRSAVTRLFKYEATDVGLLLWCNRRRVSFPVLLWLLLFLFWTSVIPRWLWLVLTRLCVSIIVGALVITSLLLVLPIFAARPLEATTSVPRSVVDIPAVVFIVAVVTPVLFLFMFFFLRIIVISVGPVLSVLVPISICVLGSLGLASLVISTWGTLGLHASYYGRMSVKHVIFTLLHHVGFRVTYWAVDPHVTVHRGIPGVEANGTLDRLTEMTFLVLR